MRKHHLPCFTPIPSWAIFGLTLIAATALRGDDVQNWQNLTVAWPKIEQITLDSGAGHLKDSIMPRYAELIYNGFWFAPEREMLQAAIDQSQEKVSGTVRLKLYKGMAQVVGRKSPNSLYSERHVTFEDDAGAYDQQDAAGFIKLNALRLRLLAQRDQR